MKLNPRHIAAMILGVGLYTAPDAHGNRTLIGTRARVGGERSKYMPHQGEREIARRIRQAYRDYGNGLPLAWNNLKLEVSFPPYKEQSNG